MTVTMLICWFTDCWVDYLGYLEVEPGDLARLSELFYDLRAVADLTGGGCDLGGP